MTPYPTTLKPDLHALLPAVHRIEDLRRGRALEALLRILSDQADLVRRDVEGLYDDLFIDTCTDWVVPYLGELVGTRPLHDVDQSRRRDVARTIQYRRRKGILSMLEGLAADVTGWSVHAAAEFERLGWSQHLEHVRSHGPPPRWSVRIDPQASLVGAAPVRCADVMDNVRGHLDPTTRTVDVRHHGRDGPRPHPRNVTFHALPHKDLETRRQFLRRVALAPGHPYHGRAFRIGQLDADLPLFGTDGPLRSLVVHADLERARKAFLAGGVDEEGLVGPRGALQFWDGDDPVPARAVHVMGLGDWGTVDVEDEGDPGNVVKASSVPGSLRYIDHGGAPLPGPDGNDAPLVPIRVTVDVATGRVIQHSGARRMRVTYRRGVPALLGGGAYRREGARPLGDPWQATVGPGDSLATVLNEWDALQGPAPVGLITVDTDEEPRDALTSINVPEDAELVVRAGPMKWPHLRGPVHVHGAPNARLTLDGICVQGRLRIDGPLDLHLRHSTLMPGLRRKPDGSLKHPMAPAIEPADDADLKLRIDHSVVGPLRLDPDMTRVHATDSILQAPEEGGGPGVAFAGRPPSGGTGSATWGGPLRLERCTVFGTVHARTLDASETLFVDPVTVERRQEGCVRFSHVPHGSLAPRGFRCQPAGEEEALGPQAGQEALDILRHRVAPIFVSRRYGHPDYARLRPDTHPAVREGAEDGRSMGAHHMLGDPLREQNLDARMEEYLPLGRRHTLSIHEARP